MPLAALLTRHRPPRRRRGARIAAIGLLGLALIRPAVALRTYVERPTATSVNTLELKSDRSAGPGRLSSRRTRTLRSKLDIQTRGWVYHPALMVFSASLRPESENQSSSGTSALEEENGTRFLGLSLDTTWLQFKPYTINLFAYRNRSRNTNSLSSDSRTETALYRGKLNLKYPILPTILSLERHESRTEGNFSSSRNTNSVRVESHRKQERGDTRFEGKYEQEARKIRGSSFDLSRLRASINNDYAINPRIKLGSGLSYSSSESNGTAPTTSAIANSRLHIQHRENLSSSYALMLSARSHAAFSSTNESLSAGLSHRLYENLTTNLSGNASKSQDSNGTLDNYAGSLQLSYVRKIPWGHISASLGRRDRLDDDNHSGISTVADENHTFSNVGALIGEDNDVFITLMNENVIAGTIRVKDAGGATLQEFTDYLVVTAGKKIRIERVTGGLSTIALNDTIAIDYQFNPSPPSRIWTVGENFGIGLNLFGMLDLSYRRSHTVDNFLSGVRPDELADDTQQNARAELEWRFSNTRIDWEDSATLSTPRTRWSVSETLSFRPSGRLSIGAGADYGVSRLKDTGEVARAASAKANLSWIPWRRARFRFNALYQLRDVATTSTVTRQIDAILEGRYGAWRPSVRFTFSDELERHSKQQQRDTTIMFRLERDFDFRRFR